MRGSDGRLVSRVRRSGSRAGTGGPTRRLCPDCGAFRYPLTLLCPACRSFDFEWVASSGRGTVYSYTVVHHQTHPAFAVPYTIVLAEMEEGPRVVAQLRAPEGTAVSIGMPVRVEWEDHPEQPLPVFVPA